MQEKVMSTAVQEQTKIMGAFMAAKDEYVNAYQNLRSAEDRLANAKAVLEDSRSRVAKILENALQVPVDTANLRDNTKGGETDECPYPTEYEARPGQYTRPARI